MSAPTDCIMLFTADAESPTSTLDVLPSIRVHLHAQHSLLASIHPLSGRLEFVAQGEVSSVREQRLRNAADKVDLRIGGAKSVAETLGRVRASVRCLKESSLKGRLTDACLPATDHLGRSRLSSTIPRPHHHKTTSSAFSRSHKVRYLYTITSLHPSSWTFNKSLSCSRDDGTRVQVRVDWYERRS